MSGQVEEEIDDGDGKTHHWGFPNVLLTQTRNSVHCWDQKSVGSSQLNNSRLAKMWWEGAHIYLKGSCCQNPYN